LGRRDVLHLSRLTDSLHPMHVGTEGSDGARANSGFAPSHGRDGWEHRRLKMNEQKFEDFSGKMVELFRNLRGQVYRILIARLKPHAKELSACSELQMESLATQCQDLLRKNILMKVRAYGSGAMSWHLVENQGMTYDKFMGLPSSDRNRLNNPEAEVLVSTRNHIKNVKSRSLTKYQMHKVVSGRRPERGILGPEEQGQPRPYRRGDGPSYFLATSFEVLDDHVLVEFQQGAGKFKGRIPFDMLRRMTDHVR
jgi:hypothetical protein